MVRLAARGPKGAGKVDPISEVAAPPWFPEPAGLSRQRQPSHLLAARAGFSQKAGRNAFARTDLSHARSSPDGHGGRAAGSTRPPGTRPTSVPYLRGTRPWKPSSTRLPQA